MTNAPRHLPSRRPSCRRRRARGFTLIELLVVLGVILVLVGIIFVGISYVSRSARERDTRVMLDNLNSMLAEMETAGSLTTVYTSVYGVADPIARTAPGPGATDTQSPAFVTVDEPIEDSYDVMLQLARMPRNKTALQQLPPEKLQAWPATPVPAEKAQPLLLDGYGHVIIFVPPQGLDGVLFEEHGSEEHIITSLRVLEDGQTLAATEKPRPFWASAGPDGNFQTGDDNVYSFEN